ncbi:hypothetical protein LXL04_031790 [Taraxacum kok-saghyz]
MMVAVEDGSRGCQEEECSVVEIDDSSRRIGAIAAVAVKNWGFRKPRSQPSLQPWDLFSKLTNPLLFGVLLLVVSLFEVSESGFTVKTLPGFPGNLPFNLETGYIKVGESNDIQYFYYFVESEGNPKEGPVALFLMPLCIKWVFITSLFFTTPSPFTINYVNSTLEKQMLEINPHSWTKAANIIFLDQPAGTGFSYAKNPEAYITNDTFATKHAYHFLKKWLVDHPKFLNNPFYVGADSYAGIIAPIIVHEIYNGNEVGEGPHVNIKGYVSGNPGTDAHKEYNSRIQYAHRMALLSDTIYKSVKENCHGEYLNVDPNNTLCINDLQLVNKCLGRIQTDNILENSCEIPNAIRSDIFIRELRDVDNPVVHISSLHQVQKQGCRSDNYLYTAPWANRKEVREALHIHEEFNETEWLLCNETLAFYIDKPPISYTHDVLSVVPYHQQLTHKKCRALVYSSGDHDMIVPYLSTMNWVESLGLLTVNDWRPWFVNKQVAGLIHHKIFKPPLQLDICNCKGEKFSLLKTSYVSIVPRKL